MIRKYLLPVLAVAGLAFAIWMVKQAAKPVIPAKPVAEPARSPFANKISGAGIVEASTRNISIGSHVPGIVAKVFVSVGKRVKAGDPLFALDDRKQQADLAVKEAALNEARARLAKLKQAPRAEELPPALARVKEAEAILEDARHQLHITEKLKDARAIAIDDVIKRQYAVDAAEARLTQTKADLTLLEAGSWKPDIDVATANIAAAEAVLFGAGEQVEQRTFALPLDHRVDRRLADAVRRRPVHVGAAEHDRRRGEALERPGHLDRPAVGDRIRAESDDIGPGGGDAPCGLLVQLLPVIIMPAGTARHCCASINGFECSHTDIIPNSRI
jgi:multidrug efflux pump subunit AcrA (membrane-fusion protein)